mgnify:FL=1|jgi:hypothetical protein
MASIDIFLEIGATLQIGGNQLQGGQSTLSIKTGKDTITYFGSDQQIENLISEIGGE